MTDFKSLHEGYVLAKRFGDSDMARSFLQRIEGMLKSSQDSIPPRDVARFQLTEAERMLYEPPPKGYEGALEILEKLPRDAPSITQEPGYFVFLAAALGQQYANETPRNPKTVERAIEAIRQARYAGQTDWLHYLADPNRGAREATKDDDLVVIAREQPEVWRALGMTAQADAARDRGAISP